MTKLVTARAEIMAAFQQIATDWQTAKGYELVIEADNTEAVDQASQQHPYLMVSAKNLNGDQLDLGSDPNTKQSGQILVSACVRAGRDTVEALELLDFVGRYFANVDFTTVRCYTFQAVGGKDVKGWWYESGIINYWYIWRKSE